MKSLSERSDAQKTQPDDKSSCPGKDTLPTSTKSDRYDLLTRTLHWIFALGIIYATVVGYSLHFVADGPAKTFFAHLNMSLATILIALFPCRVAWRHFRKNPPPIQRLPAHTLRLASGLQNAIYVTIAWVLTSGYLMVPDHYRFFGLVTIPTPFSKGIVTEFMFMQHRVSCICLSTLVALHVLAALKHHLLAKIPVIYRMI